jgi:hypothetical protein
MTGIIIFMVFIVLCMANAIFTPTVRVTPRR